MYNISKQGNDPALRLWPCLFHHSYNFVMRNSNEMLLLFPRVGAILMNFKHKFVKVRLEAPEFIKCQRSYLLFKSALTEFCFAPYGCSPLLYPVSQFFLHDTC